MHQNMRPRKHLEIANYPPPYDGWGTHTRFVVEEIRRRGHTCEVLKINENRQIKSAEYVDVQNGSDYLFKVIRFAARRYAINVHVNAEAPKGYILALIAIIVGRLFSRKANMTFHGGLPQSFFPVPKSSLWYWKFKFLFGIASGILCDSDEIKREIVRYGVKPDRIGTAAGFSAQNLKYQKSDLGAETEGFLRAHDPVFFCYVSFRPEYRLEVLRKGMTLFRKGHPHAGFIWLGFPEKEMPDARDYVSTFSADESASLLLLGTLSHDEFLTLLLRCTAKLRTPACDGVSASVLESLALGVPVVASENGRRPSGVMTYAEIDATDMCRKLEHLIQNRSAIIHQIRMEPVPDNVALTADWLLGESQDGSNASHAIGAA
jgi:glycosyltransferase involved in cell wall biosynthesis